MKKISTLLIALLFLAAVPKADAQEAYEEGDILLNAGISLGTFGYNYPGDRGFSVPITLSGEYGIHEYISVGAMLGYAKYTYDAYWGYPYNRNVEYSWTFFSFGARGSFHYLPLANEHFDLDIDSEKFDFYVSLFLGIERRAYKTDAEGTFWNYSNSTDGAFGAFAGFKYMATENIGIFLEGGPHAFGWLTLGASIVL